VIKKIKEVFRQARITLACVLMGLRESNVGGPEIAVVHRDQEVGNMPGPTASVAACTIYLCLLPLFSNEHNVTLILM